MIGGAIFPISPASLRLRAWRSLIVKSRGHFRAAFDLLFADERIIEVDAPGLTTPILARVPYRNVPRPIFPLDDDMTWQVSAVD